MSDGRRGLFLDLDGTLADSLPLMREVYESFLARFGCRGSDHEFEFLNGPPLPQLVACLRQSHALEAPIEDLLETYCALLDDGYLSVAPAAGAAALLDVASERGWTAAVVTSNSARRTERWLERQGLKRYIAAIVGGDAEARGKPDPAPYRLALQRCGCNAAGSLAVEDSRAGASAAVSAGLATYVLAAQPGDSAGWPSVAGFLERLDQLIPAL